MENFHLAQQIKNKRKGFTGNQAKEVTEILKPKPVEPKPAAPAPTERKREEVAQEMTPPAVDQKKKETVGLDNGFVVGYNKDGVVALKTFGKLNEWELVGLVEYASVKARDMLNKVAKTQETETLEGIKIVAHGVGKILQGANAGK